MRSELDGIVAARFLYGIAVSTDRGMEVVLLGFFVGGLVGGSGCLYN